MIVCLCRNVNDRTIRAAIAEGAHTVEAVGQVTGAGTCCGGCRGTIAGLVALHAPPLAARTAQDRGVVAPIVVGEPPHGPEAPPLRAAADRRS